jgi:D-alanine-D-alanine ligase
MKIGIVYDLRADYLQQGYSPEQTAEFDSIETIAAIDAALKEQGYQTERVGNIKQLAAALVNGRRWDLVFNIAEGMHGIAREAQVPALLDAYNIPYVFSDAVTMAVTLDKAMAKRIVRDHGIPTAPFMVVERMSDLDAFHLAFPVFAKPLAEGTGKGINAASRVDTLSDLKSACKQLLAIHRQPVLIESFLPGREFTVGIIGNGDDTKVMGVMEITLRNNAERNAYSFENKEYYEDRVDFKIVEDAEARQAAETALRAWRALRCQDSARFDLRSDNQSVPQFLEVNPIAGLHPVRSDLVILMRLQGYSYQECLQKIMTAAIQRLGLVKSKAGVVKAVCE